MPAVTNLDPSTLDQFIARVEKIDADTPRLWGTMTPASMMAHLRRGNEITLEEIECKDESNFLTRNIVGPLAFSGFLPWPKGKLKTIAIFLPDDAEEFDVEKTKLIESMKRFVKRSEAEPDRVVMHPAMGPHTLRRTQRMWGMHNDHHLKQFGV